MDAKGVIVQVFGVERALIGVIHLDPLPGTPRAATSLDQIVTKAVGEARRYTEAGFDGLVIENMGDRPYLRRTVGPEVVAAMTAAGAAVRSTVETPLGVQVLAGANREALAVALAVGASFVRVEGFVFADIKKKHSSHALTAGVTPDNIAEYRRADGVIVGSFVKRDRIWSNDLDPGRLTRTVEAWRATAVGLG